MQMNIGKKSMSALLAVVLALSMTPVQAFAAGSQDETAAVVVAQAEADENYVVLKIGDREVKLKKEASASLSEDDSAETICKTLWDAFLINPKDYDYVVEAGLADGWEMFSNNLNSGLCLETWVSVGGYEHSVWSGFKKKQCVHESLLERGSGCYDLKVGDLKWLEFREGEETTIELSEEKGVLLSFLPDGTSVDYEALEESIVDTLIKSTNPQNGDYTVEYKTNLGLYYPIEGYRNIGCMPLDTPQDLKITFKPNDTTYAESSVYVEDVVFVDERKTTFISVSNSNPIITYCPDSDDAEEALLEALGNIVVKDEEGDVLNGVNFEVDGNYDAGLQTFTIRYAGDETRKPATLKIDVSIEKAPVEVSVKSQVVSAGEEIDSRSLVTTVPSVSTIQFTVGLDASNASIDNGTVSGVDSKVNLILPEVKIGNCNITELISQNLADKEISLSNISSFLESEDLSWIWGRAGVSDESLKQLLSTMNMLQNQFGDLSVSITNEYPSEVGVYAVGGVTVNPNYETTSGIGYLVVAPTAEEVSLEWECDLSAGFVDNDSASDVALGAKVAESPAVNANATDNVEALASNVVFGVDAEGNIILENGLEDAGSLSTGAYTELAYLLGFGEGNETLYYAEPLVRAFVVAPSSVEVGFEGDLTKAYDGEPIAIEAKVEGEGENGSLAVRYYGMQADGTFYSSETAPTNAGAYTALATYVAHDEQSVIEKAGMAVAPIFIKRAEFTATVGGEFDYGESITGIVGVVDGDEPYETVDVTIGGTKDEPRVYVNSSNEALMGLIEEAAETANVGSAVSQIVDAINKVQSGIPSYISTESAESETAASADAIEAIEKLKSELNNLPETVTVSTGYPFEPGNYSCFGFAYSPNYVPSFAEGTLTINPEPEQGGDGETGGNDGETGDGGNDGNTGGSDGDSDGNAGNGDAGNNADDDAEESETVVNPDGSVTTTVTEEDGSSVATTVSEDGSVTTVVEKDAHGDVTHIEAVVSDSSEDVASGNVVELPMEPVEPASSNEAVEIELTAPEGAKISVPVVKAEGAETVDFGCVLVMVGADGSETVMPKTGVSEDGLELEVPGDCVLKVVEASVDFPDVAGGEWYAIQGVDEFASSRGILTGVVLPDGSMEFQGDVQTTRGMFVTMLNRMELKPAASDNAPSFPDVSEGIWYDETSAWAAEQGILTGYIQPDGTALFGGDNLVTREQIAVFLMRYANWLGLDTSARVKSSAPDAAEVSEWADDAVSWAVAEGYIRGDEATGELRPTEGATRAEAAAIIMRFVNSMY